MATLHDPDAVSTSGDKTALYRINDDPEDLPPAVAIGDATVDEGDGTAAVPVSLQFTGDTTETEQDVTVAYTVVNGTAKAPGDFTATPGSVTIAAGLDSAEISVPVVNDVLFEGSQAFTVKLGKATPTGVVVSQAIGTVTIEDDEEAGAPTLTVPASRAGVGAVALTGKTGESMAVQLYSALVSSPNNFTLAGTATADALGNYTFSKTVSIGTIYYTKVGAFSSEKRTVQLVQVPVLTGSSTVKGVAALSVKGNPTTAGQTATIQRYAGNNVWTTVATGKLSTAGVFVTSNTGLKSGSSYIFRAVIAATPAQGILAGTSTSVTVAVR
jgi:hypothetical protein